MSDSIMRPWKVSFADLSDSFLPALVSPKYDGIRINISPDGPKTNSGKSIPNKFLSSILQTLPVGFEAEIVATNPETDQPSFQSTTSVVMSKTDSPELLQKFPTTIWLFNFSANPDMPYQSRYNILANFANTYPNVLNVAFRPAQADFAYSLADLETIRDSYIDQNQEGLVLHPLDAPYYPGKCSKTKPFQLAVKFKQDAEFQVIDLVAQIDKHGVTQDLLGAVVLKGNNLAFPDTTFQCGTGFTAAQRKFFWDNPQEILDHFATIEYLLAGTKDVPRQPVFKALRHPSDFHPDTLSQITDEKQN